jgi:hypothetical protein
MTEKWGYVIYAPSNLNPGRANSVSGASSCDTRGGTQCRITRFFTGSDNETHFEELEIPLQGSGTLHASDRIAAETVMFLDNRRAAGDAGGFHNAPQRQLVVMLSGVHEVRTASGESRRWGTGDVFFPDDTTGRIEVIWEAHEEVAHRWLDDRRAMAVAAKYRVPPQP